MYILLATYWLTVDFLIRWETGSEDVNREPVGCGLKSLKNHKIHNIHHVNLNFLKIDVNTYFLSNSWKSADDTTGQVHSGLKQHQATNWLIRYATHYVYQVQLDPNEINNEVEV